MHKPKAIFLDLDGTLLSGDKTIPAENTAAIQEAAQLGTQIVLCSGRPPVTMQNIIRELGLDTLGGTAICFNGAALYDCGNGRMLQASRLDPDLVRAVFSEADALGIHTQVYDAGGLVTRSMDRETEFYMKTTGIPDRLLPSLPDGLTEMPCKMLCISLDDPDRLETLKQRLLASYGARINVFYSSESFLEIVRTGVDKGSGIRQLCRYPRRTRSASATPKMIFPCCTPSVSPAAWPTAPGNARRQPTILQSGTATTAAWPRSSADFSWRYPDAQTSHCHRYAE